MGAREPSAQAALGDLVLLSVLGPRLPGAALSEKEAEGPLKMLLLSLQQKRLAKFISAVGGIQTSCLLTPTLF